MTKKNVIRNSALKFGPRHFFRPTKLGARSPPMTGVSISGTVFEFKPLRKKIITVAKAVKRVKSKNNFNANSPKSQPTCARIWWTTRVKILEMIPFLL